jgi:hypothetical protein
VHTGDADVVGGVHGDAHLAADRRRH